MATTTISRWIPANATECQHPNGLGVAYAYSLPNGKSCVIAYDGNQSKRAFHESYRDAEKRDVRIAEHFAALTSSALQKKEWRDRKNAAHSMVVGDIIHHSWGWEQTQCDFYQVLAVTAHGATIQAISSATVPDSCYSHGMAEMQTATPNAFCGEPLKVRIDGTNRVTTLKHGSAAKWDGRPKYCSWYA